MHELALARSVLRIAERVADGREVSQINLDIGVLRQVVPQALETAWTASSRGTTNLAAAKLDIHLIPAVITCQRCASDTVIDEKLVFACAHCSSTDYRVKTGEEFTLTSLDVVE